MFLIAPPDCGFTQMNTDQTNPTLGYGITPRSNFRRRLGTVLIAGLLAILCAGVTANLFGSIRSPELFLWQLPWIAVCFIVSTAGMFLLRPQRVWAQIMLASICLIPPLIVLLYGVAVAGPQMGSPETFFRHHLMDPIPTSVVSLRFVSDSALPTYETSPIMQFTISPRDLDRILHSHGLNRVRPDELRSKTVGSLPLEGKKDAEFYEGVDSDCLYTLKVSRDHTRVLFRFENGISERATEPGGL